MGVPLKSRMMPLLDGAPGGHVSLIGGASSNASDKHGVKAPGGGKKSSVPHGGGGPLEDDEGDDSHSNAWSDDGRTPLAQNPFTLSGLDRNTEGALESHAAR